MHGTVFVIGEFQLVMNAFQHVFSRFHTIMIQFSSNSCMETRHALSWLKFVTDDICFCCIIHEEADVLLFLGLFFLMYRSCFFLVWNSTHSWLLKQRKENLVNEEIYRRLSVRPFMVLGSFFLSAPNCDSCNKNCLYPNERKNIWKVHICTHPYRYIPYFYGIL